MISKSLPEVEQFVVRTTLTRCTREKWANVPRCLETVRRACLETVRAAYMVVRREECDSEPGSVGGVEDVYKLI